MYLQKLILLFLLLLAGTFTAYAQVGINTDDPAQTLDVNGKLAIADDAFEPTEGTLRFNATTRIFEGHDGTEWSALTNVPALGGGAIPAGAIPVYGNSTAISASDEVQNINISYGDGSQSRTTVPANTFLIVTWVNVYDNNIQTESDVVRVRVGPSATTRGIGTSSRSVEIHGDLLHNLALESSLSPLIIARPGEYLTAYNGRLGTETVNVQFRGFLVPALSY